MDADEAEEWRRRIVTLHFEFLVELFPGHGVSRPWICHDLRRAWR